MEGVLHCHDPRLCGGFVCEWFDLGPGGQPMTGHSCAPGVPNNEDLSVRTQDQLERTGVRKLRDSVLQWTWFAVCDVNGPCLPLRLNLSETVLKMFSSR